MFNVTEQASVRYYSDRTLVFVSCFMARLLRVCLALCSIFFLSFFAVAERDNRVEPENIQLENLTNDQQHALVLLGKVWGFNKYFHPEIAKGAYFWDQELYQFLPQYLSAVAKNQHQQLLLEWLQHYSNQGFSQGELAQVKKGKTTPKFVWLNQDISHVSLQSFMFNIVNIKAKPPLHYVQYSKYLPTLKFTNELTYVQGSDNAAARVIGLFRLWNQIYYFYPFNNSKQLESWQQLFLEAITLVINAEESADYGAVYLQLMSTLEDTNNQLLEGTELIAEARGQYYSPLQLAWVEDMVVIDALNDDVTFTLPVAIGDRIIKIDGINVSEIINERLWQYPGSNKQQRINLLLADILVSFNKTVDLTIKSQRDGNIIHQTLPLLNRSTEPDLIKSTKSSKLAAWLKQGLSDSEVSSPIENIALIPATSISLESLENYMFSLSHTPNLIIDLRGFVSRDITHALYQWLYRGSAQETWIAIPDLEQIGTTRTEVIPPIKTKNELPDYRGKIVLLINHQTMNFAEHLAYKLKGQANVSMIGSNTAGAMSYASTTVIPGGLSLKFSTGVLVDQQEKPLPQSVVPDAIVAQSIKDTDAGKDTLLNAAISSLR